MNNTLTVLCFLFFFNCVSILEAASALPNPQESVIHFHWTYKSKQAASEHPYLLPENYLNNILEWKNKNPLSRVILYYGSEFLSSDDQVQATELLFADKIELKDVFEIEIIDENKDILLQVNEPYFLFDFFRVAAVLDFAKNNPQIKYITYFDMQFEPRDQMEVFDGFMDDFGANRYLTMDVLEEFGLVLLKNPFPAVEQPYENGFFIVNTHNYEMMKAQEIALLLANLMRVKKILAQGDYQDDQQKSSLRQIVFGSYFDLAKIFWIVHGDGTFLDDHNTPVPFTGELENFFRWNRAGLNRACILSTRGPVTISSSPPFFGERRKRRLTWFGKNSPIDTVGFLVKEIEGARVSHFYLDRLKEKQLTLESWSAHFKEMFFNFAGFKIAPERLPMMNILAQYMIAYPPINSLLEEEKYRQSTPTKFACVPHDELRGQKISNDLADAIYDDLEFIDSLLSSKKIPYTLFRRSLLSAYKNGGLSPFDTSVDIAIPIDYEENFKALLGELSKENYYLLHGLSGFLLYNRNRKLQLSTIEISFLSEIKTDDDDPGFFTFADPDARLLWKNKELIPEFVLRNPERISFGHLTVNAIPRGHAFIYFSRAFGADWMKADSEIYQHVSQPSFTSDSFFTENEITGWYVAHGAKKNLAAKH